MMAAGSPTKTPYRSPTIVGKNAEKTPITMAIRVAKITMIMVAWDEDCNFVDDLLNDALLFNQTANKYT